MDFVGRRLPEEMREFFKKPFGKDIRESELSELNTKQMLITVGDVVSLVVRNYGLVPDITIYDGMTERREMTDFATLVKNKGWKETVVKNEAGTITAELVAAIKNALTGHNEIIRVVGEEDLATLPCILFAPEGTNIIYGWPGKGMKAITTDACIIEETLILIEKMEELE